MAGSRKTKPRPKSKRFTQKSHKHSDLNSCDFTKYGILRKITRQSDLEDFTSADINHCSVIGINKIPVGVRKKKCPKNPDPIFYFPTSGRYTVTYTYSTKGEPESGAYGCVYHVKSDLGTQFAIKMIYLFDTKQLTDTVLEALANIILYEDTARRADGPYVQKIYEIAYDPDNNVVCFRLQYFAYTLLRFIGFQQSKTMNDILIPDVLIKISNYLSYLENTFEINHRDLKSNNIMIDSGENPILIDLGFICMKWKGLNINASNTFKKMDAKYPGLKHDECPKIGRDLIFLVQEIVSSQKMFLSERLKKYLEEFATVTYRNKKCKLYLANNPKKVGCDEIFRDRDDYQAFYEFLNRSDVDLSSKAPAVMISLMESFKKHSEYHSRKFFSNKRSHSMQHDRPDLEIQQ